ncbi:MAG: cell wall-active antibiotics response protein [Ignavibacteriae bacterium]|nr:cell wall-active antibiotics response protein [Ignavibacteria bacterium]MBI3363434.1 cell wall-active antibiotics response protein [Ignavibacteriota bacterium]
MRNFTGGLILLTIGTLLLLDNLGIADFGDMVKTFWPLIIIAIGASILLRRRTYSPPPDTSITPAQIQETTQRLDSDLIHQSIVFGDIFFTATSQNFKGGSLSTVFGDGVVNLSNIRIAEGDHVLRVHGVFGKTTIILPPDGAIVITASSVLGDMSILGQRRGGFSSDLRTATSSYTSASNRLTININRVFGEIRVE